MTVVQPSVVCHKQLAAFNAPVQPPISCDASLPTPTVSHFQLFVQPAMLLQPIAADHEVLVLVVTGW